MRRGVLQRTFLTAALAGCVLTAAGCDSVLGRLSGAYRGPQPETEPLAGETVIVRSVNPQPTTDVVILDRVRYLEHGMPHDVNRVVQAITTDIRPQVQMLDLHPGDRVVVSTRFLGIGETGDLREVPDWPGHDYLEYPIGLHAITAITRTAP